MDIFPEVVGKEFIVLRSREAASPDQLTDGQLLAQLRALEKVGVSGAEPPAEVQARLERLREEARRRFLITGP